jgi:hypothetical protein
VAAERAERERVVWLRVTRLFPDLKWDTVASSRLREFAKRAYESTAQVVTERADFLSRLCERNSDPGTWPGLVACEHPELVGIPRVDVSQAWLRLCNPHQEWESDSEFEQFWRDVQVAVREPAVVL